MADDARNFVEIIDALGCSTRESKRLDAFQNLVTFKTSAVEVILINEAGRLERQTGEVGKGYYKYMKH